MNLKLRTMLEICFAKIYPREYVWNSKLQKLVASKEIWFTVIVQEELFFKCRPYYIYQTDPNFLEDQLYIVFIKTVKVSCEYSYTK